jgi:hypothetical protein
VVYTDAKGTSREISGAEFENLPLRDRVKIVLTGNPRFSLNGQEVTVRNAVVQE